MLLKTFSGDAGKTAVKKVLKNYQKNVFSSVLFKNSPIHPVIAMRKLTPAQIFPLFVLRILKLVGENLW